MQSAFLGRIALNAKALKELRKINGVSQERLAEECLQRKIPVSVASIKRAEAGKNVLYRTIANLACYFDIPVDQLLDDAPLSLWRYSKNKDTCREPCFGRDFELQQLHDFYNQTLQSKVSGPVYVYGLPGIGKSCLINNFLNQVKLCEQQIIRINIEPSSADHPVTSREFIRRLLGVALLANDSVIRHRINEIFISPYLGFYIMKIAGVRLFPAELKALEKLTNKDKENYNHVASKQLLSYLISHGHTVMIIENMQNADDDLLSLIKAYCSACHNSGFFLLLCASDIMQFASPPDWLQYARQIHLKPLNQNAMHAIIQYQWQGKDQKPSQLVKLKEHLTCGSQGHPGLLLHQLQHFPDCEIRQLTEVQANSSASLMCRDDITTEAGLSRCMQTSDLYQWVRKTIKSFGQEQKRLLSFLALSELAFDIRLIGFFVENSNSQDTFYFLHQYLTLGLLQQVADKYCFRHNFIRLTVLDQTSHQEQSLLGKLRQKYQVSRK